jgi:hypothetical protein
MPTMRYPKGKPNSLGNIYRGICAESSDMINGFCIFLKIISVACGISAMILISLAIAFPNGITYYEDRIPVKIFEIMISLIAVIYLSHDLGITLRKSKWLK